MFKQGQEVVCVDDTWAGMDLGGLKKGEIYVVEYVTTNVEGIILENMKSGHPFGAYWWVRFKLAEKNNKEILKEEKIEI